MFSGKGVYVDGVIVAIEYDDELRLKADRGQRPGVRGGRRVAVDRTDGHRGAVADALLVHPRPRRSTTRSS